MNTRLQQFLAAENLTQAQFADSIKVARASISHIIAGRNNPGYDFIINTMKRYPDLNVEWLLLGKGKMYKSMKQDSTAAAIQQDNSPDVPELDLGLFSEPQDGASETAVSAPNDEETTASRSDIGVQDTGPVPNIVTPTDMNPAGNTFQTTVKQRKASKIIIFYDDGTYQEF